MPNKIVSDEVDINNPNYTGKYMLSVPNARYIDDYQVRLNFVDKTPSLPAYN